MGVTINPIPPEILKKLSKEGFLKYRQQLVDAKNKYTGFRGLKNLFCKSIKNIK